MGRMPMLTSGLGMVSECSRKRVPNPPQNKTTFIPSLRRRVWPDSPADALVAWHRAWLDHAATVQQQRWLDHVAEQRRQTLELRPPRDEQQCFGRLHRLRQRGVQP